MALRVRRKAGETSRGRCLNHSPQCTRARRQTTIPKKRKKVIRARSCADRFVPALRALKVADEELKALNKECPNAAVCYRKGALDVIASPGAAEMRIETHRMHLLRERRCCFQGVSCTRPVHCLLPTMTVLLSAWHEHRIKTVPRWTAPV